MHLRGKHAATSHEGEALVLKAHVCMGGNGRADPSVLTSAGTAGADDYYFCRGLECYVFHEPCVMCAMALTHSRVARVVFCEIDHEAGALGGRVRLQSVRALNHRYHVYHIDVADELHRSFKSE